MLEADGDDKTYSPPTAEDDATYCALVDSSEAGSSFASEVPVPVLDMSDSPGVVVAEASNTVSLGVAA